MKMARDDLETEYKENMNDEIATTTTVTTTTAATTIATNNCNCNGNTIEKCCNGIYHEPFFLHPPGARPMRDGIYINPMNEFLNESQKVKETESFYLHSPHELVYTRITRLFCDTLNNEKSRNGIERKDEPLTVKVDVHINNGSYKSVSNGNSIKSDIIKESEHAYEQICIRPDENESIKSLGPKKINDDIYETRSRTIGRRFSRSSSGSESSQLSSEIPCYSSTTSTPSLSRKSCDERVENSPKPPELPERKITTPSDGEKDLKPTILPGPSIIPPPPPPLPPPPDVEETPGSPKQVVEAEKDLKEVKSESKNTLPAANKSEVSCDQTEVAPGSVISPTADTEDTSKTNQVSHLVNKHMVLPFIPPTFTNVDSETLLKPSEYLKSICKSSNKNTLSKARSVDNLDIQGRTDEEEVERIDDKVSTSGGPPPPPMPPPILIKESISTVNLSGTMTSTANQEPETPKTHQPLATISIQDLSSVQLRRTNMKIHATKTFSAPPPRSVSMTNVSEPFFVQKTDLIAELKKAKDIPGIKKFKVEMARVEKTNEQNLISEISKSFSVSNFVDQIPEKDSAGNVIPIWKRQMLARKAAERAKKELEEQIARENEEKRQKAIPPWKRQLLAKKDSTDPQKILTSAQPVATPLPSVKIEVTQPTPVKEPVDKPIEDKRVIRSSSDSDEETTPIIPWRAQLRKTNSKLNILD